MIHYNWVFWVEIGFACLVALVSYLAWTSRDNDYRLTLERVATGYIAAALFVLTAFSTDTTHTVMLLISMMTVLMAMFGGVIARPLGGTGKKAIAPPPQVPAVSAPPPNAA